MITALSTLASSLHPRGGEGWSSRTATRHTKAHAQRSKARQPCHGASCARWCGQGGAPSCFCAGSRTNHLCCETEETPPGGCRSAQSTQATTATTHTTTNSPLTRPPFACPHSQGGVPLPLPLCPLIGRAKQPPAATSTKPPPLNSIAPSAQLRSQTRTRRMPLPRRCPCRPRACALVGFCLAAPQGADHHQPLPTRRGSNQKHTTP